MTEGYQTCAPLFAALKEIPYAVIKGAVLLKDAYGSPFLRKSGDIDLLTAREHVDKVKQILLDQGFVQGRVTEQGLIPFSRRELLFQTAMSHQTAPFVEQTANPRCPYVNADMGVPIRNLSPEMVFLSLPAPLQGHEFHLSPI